MAERQPQPEWSQAIERLGAIAARGSTVSNLALNAHNNTARLYAIVRQLIDATQRLNDGRLTAEEVIAAAQQAGNIQRGDIERIQTALSEGPSQEQVQTIIQEAGAIIGDAPERPGVGGAKKRRRRGGYKRSPTSGERRIASGSTRRKRSSRGKRSKRSPTKKRTRTRTGGRRRR